MPKRLYTTSQIPPNLLKSRHKVLGWFNGKVIQKKKDPVKKKKKKEIVIKQVHRRLTIQQKYQIIFLLYGSLTDFDKIIRPVKVVAKALYINQSSIRNLLKNFIASEFDLNILERKKFKQHRSKLYLPENIAYLTSNDTLKKWAVLTLKERARMINEELGIKVSEVTVRNFYSKHKIKRRAPSFMLAVSKHVKNEHRRTFA